MPQITPNLWFDTQGKEAADFYVALFPNSRITDVSYYGEDAPMPAGLELTIDFSLDGNEFTIINAGPMFKFNESVSFGIACKDQAEVDHYWDALVADGGEEGQCGWLKDRFGLSWQVTPEGIGELFMDPDPGRVQRAMAAMMGMRKLDLAAMRAAADAG